MSYGLNVEMHKQVSQQIVVLSYHARYNKGTFYDLDTSISVCQTPQLWILSIEEFDNAPASHTASGKNEGIKGSSPALSRPAELRSHLGAAGKLECKEINPGWLKTGDA